MTRCVRIGIAALLVSGAAATVTVVPASAQDLLFIGDAAIGSAGRFGERLGTAPPEVHGQLMNGGRTLVSGHVAIDTASGERLPIFFGDVLAVEASGPRVFSYDGQTVSMYRVDTGQSTPLVAAQRQPLQEVSARYAPDVRQLFVLRVTANRLEFVVVDVDTATVRRSFPAPWLFTYGWRVSPDGRRLVVNASSFGPSLLTGVLLIDAGSGAVLSVQPPASYGAGDLVDDRHFARSYVVSRFELAAYDDDAQLLGALPLSSSCAQPTVAVSPHTGRIYVVDSIGGGQFYGQPMPIHHYLTVYDGETARRIDAREITDAAGLSAGSNSCSSLPITVVTAPGAPQRLAASVSGHELSLSWRDGGGVAAGYALEVGLVASQTVLTIDLGRATSATFSSVPPGRYVMRLRATNPFGVSRPSEEITVVVR